jgi:hypothetical protein
MTKLVMWLIRILFWLQAFAAPLLLFGLLSIFVYNDGKHNKGLAIVLLVSGVVAGTILAEWIRRKYGPEAFFANIYNSNDLDKPGKEENEIR